MCEEREGDGFPGLYSAAAAMSVLDRLASPLKSRDPVVRRRAVQKHPPSDAGTLAELARSDPDAGVRKEAVRRLEAPRTLLELRETAGDEEARRLARSRSESLLVKIAADDRDLGESERALALLSPLGAVAEVACRARFESVRGEAARRLTASAEGEAGREASLAVVAGRGGDPSLRVLALRAIRSDSGLFQVATSAGARETARAAVRRLEDPETLLRVAASAAPKSVRNLAERRARERLPAEHPLAVQEREAALSGCLDRIAEAAVLSDERERLVAEADALVRSGPVEPALLDRFESLRGRAAGADSGGGAARRLLTPAESGSPPESNTVRRPVTLPRRVEEVLARLEDEGGDLGSAEVEAAEREVEQLLPEHGAGSPPRVRLRAAIERARKRALARKKQRIHEFEFAELADQAVSLADSLGGRPSGNRLAKGRRELSRLARRFERFEGAGGDDAERFRKAAARAETLLAAAEGVREKKVERSRERIREIEERLEALETREPFPLDEAEAALRDLGALRGDAEVWRSIGAERQARFQRLQAALLPRLREAREIHEWRRWSNLEEQPALIRKARALLEESDIRRVDRELAALDRAWHEVRHADRDRGQELWEEWDQVRGELLERVGPLREAAERELERKLEHLAGLAERAEKIAETADPRQVAAMRGLMTEWREGARGLGKKSNPVWKRFRAANDTYFNGIKAVRKQWLAEMEANIPIREALIARAKELREQPGLDAVRSTVRELMSEWKAAPPVPRKHGDRLWEEFRAACDAVRDRARLLAGEGSDVAGERGEAAPPESEAERSLRDAVSAVVALPAGKRAGAAEAVWQEYRRLPAGGARTRRIGATLTDCLREAFGAAPETFPGTRFDQDELAGRLASLLGRIEALDRREPKPRPGDGAAGFVERLRGTLGMGRAAEPGAELREAARTAEGLVERAGAAGPALAEPAVRTLGRIEEIAKRVIARAPAIREGRTRDGDGRGPRGAGRRRGGGERRRVG